MYQTLSHSFTGRLNGVTLKSALGILKDWCFFLPGNTFETPSFNL